MAMRVTLDEILRVNIEGVKGKEILSLLRIIDGASLEDRRMWIPIANELRETPLDKLPWSGIISLADEVKEMRRLQKTYFKTRSQEVLKASIVQERKVDDLVNEILNRM